MKPADVDLIIVSTSSPEHVFPATACLVQDRIGAVKAGAFDLSAACSGFIYALDIGTQMIRTGSIKNAIIIGAETLSRLVNWQDRSTCILFGDGAGAFVLQARADQGGVLRNVFDKKELKARKKRIQAIGGGEATAIAVKEVVQAIQVSIAAAAAAAAAASAAS